MLMALGVGSYTPKNQLSSIQLGENVLANGAVVFIWHWKPNFNIGGGAALNNTFGYPMIFPSFYLKYKGGFSNKFTIDISLLDGAKVAFGYTVHNNLNLKLVTNLGGYAAYLQRNNQKEIFTQQNIITGIQRIKNRQIHKYPHYSRSYLFAYRAIHQANPCRNVRVRS